MRNKPFKQAVIAITLLAIASAALLWSWNTLSALFGGPAADYRHAIALLVGAIVIRGFVYPRFAPHGDRRHRRTAQRAVQ